MRCLVLGASGQDGSYIAESLVADGCDVHCAVRRTSEPRTRRVAGATYHKFDLHDLVGMVRLVSDLRPQEVYNMADQDNVDWSFATPLYSADVTGRAVAALLGCGVPMLQPISATVFGTSPDPLRETALLNPMSPYACAKAHAWLLCKYHRRVHGVDVACPILFNHDSVRRNSEYYLHRVALRAGGQAPDAGVALDIGHAPEYASGMVRLLRHGPVDMCMGTKAVHSAMVLEAAGCTPDGTEHDRPGGPAKLVSDCTRARHMIGWAPQENATHVVKRLVEHYRCASAQSGTPTTAG